MNRYRLYRDACDLAFIKGSALLSHESHSRLLLHHLSSSVANISAPSSPASSLDSQGQSSPKCKLALFLPGPCIPSSPLLGASFPLLPSHWRSSIHVSWQLQGERHASSNSKSPAILEKSQTGIKPRLEQVFRLHATALWQQHRFKVYAATSFIAVWATWRLTRAIASIFIDVSFHAAQWGLLGMAFTIVASCIQVLRWRFGINPATVYRKAMLQLNSHPGVLEVMGAPLIGSDMRAYVVTGGGAYLSRKAFLKPKVRSRRIQMIFPLTGSEHSGMVSVEAKKKKGQHVFKMLAVDVRPSGGSMAVLQPARIYLAGDDTIYSRGNVLEQMRGPFLQATQLQPALDFEDEEEDEKETAALEMDAVKALRAAEEGPQKGGQQQQQQQQHTTNELHQREEARQRGEKGQQQSTRELQQEVEAQPPKEAQQQMEGLQGLNGSSGSDNESREGTSASSRGSEVTDSGGVKAGGESSGRQQGESPWWRKLLWGPPTPARKDS